MSRDRLAIVTGATSGIGRSIVERLIGDGHTVVGIARRESNLQELSLNLNRRGRRFLSCPGDAAESATLEHAIALCTNELARIPDLYVFSAGRGLVGSLLESDEDRWTDLFRINSLGTLRGMRLAGRHLLRDVQESDSAGVVHPRDIVVIGSVTGRNVSVFNPVYGASKFALGSACEALRQELGKQGIRVTLIEPGIVRTEYQAVAGYDLEEFNHYESEAGPFLSGDDVARFVSFAVQEPPHVNFGAVVVRPTRQISP